MLDLSEKQIYRFENVEVDLSRSCLLLDGNEKHLRQKAFQVLVYLLEQRHRLVSKNELFEVIWKDTAVTDDVLVQCIKEIRRTLNDTPQAPRFIKTVPKSGYRFVGEIEQTRSETLIEEITKVEFEIEEEFDTDPPNKQNLLIAKEKSNFLANYRYLLAFSLLIICGFVFSLFYFGRSNQAKSEIRLPIIEGKKTIAVMFFENKTNTAEFDWLREGLADMLIADLSRSEKLTVLSRAALHNFLENRNFSANKISLDEAGEIARQAQAEYIISGSFANIGQRIRLDVQIFEVKTNNLLTTESLIVEKPEQILSEIDLLSLNISKRLNATSTKNPNLALVMTKNLEAYRYYSLAMEKASSLQAKEALELLEKAVALDRDFPMAHARIGYIYAVTWGAAEKAKPYLEKAFTLSDRLTEKDRLYISAWYAVANLDFPAGIKAYREIIQKFPTETEAYLRLGYLLRGEEQFDEAILVLRQGLAIDSNFSAFHNALGLLYSLQGKHKEAIAEHQLFVALESNDPNAHDSLGMSYQWAGRYEEAIAEYKLALQIDPKFEIAQVHLGNTYFQSGHFQNSIESFKKYIEIAPSNMERARGFGSLAYVYRKQNNLMAAKQAAKQAITVEPYQIGEMLIISADQQDWATVEKLLLKIPGDSSFSNRGSRLSLRLKNYYLGYVSLKRGEIEPALENFREALRHPALNWNVDSLEDCLANTYLEIGRYDEAIAEYQRILQLNPNYPFARFSLAQAFEKKGQIEAARNSYQSFLQSWKDADADILQIREGRKWAQ